MAQKNAQDDDYCSFNSISHHYSPGYYQSDYGLYSIAIALRGEHLACKESISQRESNLLIGQTLDPSIMNNKFPEPYFLNQAPIQLTENLYFL